ncbi:hypothetical protein TRFO_35193 [Tritrichomonas foetus]|uniref:Uncharacterized protein n=1 Tax=Tritrichomonas foetus TaxID=1144522 RepID=A0A1J4JIA0_9EUKA|nr:hypothetical protein TRFO_35193 [Tritrichomonas foetus]|eukprot:OHS98417.1 hypothetical protein TRFO_35193 [Tritrichomonas foetus]
MLNEDRTQLPTSNNTLKINQNLKYNYLNDDGYDNYSSQLPQEIKNSIELLKDDTKWEKSILSLLDYFTCLQIQLPRKTIKDLFKILGEINLISNDLMENTLALLDIALRSCGNDYKISFTSKEMSILRQYFPEKHSLDIFTSIIRLDPQAVPLILNQFPPTKDYQGFNSDVSVLISHKFLESLTSILNLVLSLSLRNEVSITFTKIFPSLVSIIPNLPKSDQLLAFKILTIICEKNSVFISVLLNHPGINSLYSRVTVYSNNLLNNSVNHPLNQNEHSYETNCENEDLMVQAFCLAKVITYNYDYPLVFFKRSKIVNLINSSIDNQQNRSLQEISIVLYNLLDDTDSINYFLKNELLQRFLSLHEAVSFNTWEDIMSMICMAVYNASNEQISFMLNFKVLEYITQISENISSNESFIGEIIPLALNTIYSYAEYEYQTNSAFVFSDETKHLLEETSLLENENFHPITTFIQKIDKLYST